MSRQSIVDLALTQIGKPYLYGAEVDLKEIDPKAFDCSGLVEWCYWRGQGLTLPRVSKDQFTFCKPADNPLPGDLGFFGDDDRGIYHVGIVADNNTMVEARGHQEGSSFDTGKVITRPLIAWVNFKNFKGFRVHPGLI